MLRDGVKKPRLLRTSGRGVARDGPSRWRENTAPAQGERDLRFETPNILRDGPPGLLRMNGIGPPGLLLSVNQATKRAEGLRHSWIKRRN